MSGVSDPCGERSQSWASYVKSVIGDSKQAVVAQRTGLDQATISRWLKHGRPGRPTRVAQFARSYPDVTTVMEAFVAAGFMTEHETKRSDEYRERGSRGHRPDHRPAAPRIAKEQS